MTRAAILWISIFAGPLAWFFDLEAGFALAPLACSGPGRIYLYAVSMASLLLVAAAGIFSLSQWRQLGPEFTDNAGQQPGGSRSLAFAGMVLSGLFILVIVAQAIPSLMMAGCE